MTLPELFTLLDYDYAKKEKKEKKSSLRQKFQYIRFASMNAICNPHK